MDLVSFSLPPSSTSSISLFSHHCLSYPLLTDLHSSNYIPIFNLNYPYYTLFKSVATNNGFMSIENLKTFDPFAEADEDTGDTKQSQNYIHIRIQQRNGRKTLTTVQGLPKKFDQKKILKVIKKKFACNGTIVNDSEMGEVIQLQGDQRKDVQEFLVDKKEGLELDAKTIKVHGF
ncbi:translation initiation factor SUI1 [Emergomyces pasteurianus Ep9510]|uniref:Translation initiation factor SUI1 n=1 Tax=Emergomyces pasteurianus Ep9510 TaxID=1447872 RepID=A0A1J9PRX7_9EURO|nr:translation initiation factor SUI1 [Emergomyces pasteurianus Ep9510]